eukprot:1823788-Prymnesium_polylepis.1
MCGERGRCPWRAVAPRGDQARRRCCFVAHQDAPDRPGPADVCRPQGSPSERLLPDGRCDEQPVVEGQEQAAAE